MSTRARVREFLQSNHGSTSQEWRQQIAARCCAGDPWPNPWQLAKALGLDVHVVEHDGFRFAVSDTAVVVGASPPEALGHRVVTAIAQHLLELSNADWTLDDVFLLAFELLMPSASIRATDPSELASCQPYAAPALVETWAEHVGARA